MKQYWCKNGCGKRVVCICKAQSTYWCRICGKEMKKEELI